MATTVAKAKRREAAMQALRGACEQLSALTDTPPPLWDSLSKDPATAEAEVLERVTAFLARLKVQPEPCPEPADPEPVRPARKR